MVVVDTMALVLRLENRRMPERSRQLFKSAEDGDLQLVIPAMVLAEIGYLSERNRIDTTLDMVNDYIDRFPKIEVYPLNFEIIKSCFQINDIPELHDRLIAATAYYLRCELITNDPKIESSRSVQTIWL